MKKFFSSPLCYAAFLLLGMLGLLLQVWFTAITPDSTGLLPRWHISTILTMVLLCIGLAAAILSAPHGQPPRLPALLRAAGTLIAAILFIIGACALLSSRDILTGILMILCALVSLFACFARIRQIRIHYWLYAVFAVAFMFYLISCYRVWSAEPETVRYVFPLLGLVSAMLAFYQKAALHSKIGDFRFYHFWTVTALMLNIIAIPTAIDPVIHVAAAAWMALEPSPRPQKKEEKKETPEEAK